MNWYSRKFYVIFALCCILILAAAPVSTQQVLTEQEKNNYEGYTSYENMMLYLQDVQAASKEMQLGVYGKTLLGRDLPYAVFSRPAISKPWEALASGKPIIVLTANVHGGEKTLRESVLVLVREFATPGTGANSLLDDVIVIAVPSVNPDGFENRPRSTRGNSHNIDMNRDYMKLEQPALAAYVQNIINTWHPHVFVDGHNGGRFPYNVCYQGPSNAAADLRITELCDREIFPFMDSKMEENGFKSWYYPSGNEERWGSGGSDPRIGRNYGGLINSVGILFESPGGQELEIGTKSGIVAYKSIVQFVAANTEKIKMYVERARRETVEMGLNATGEIAVQMRYVPEDYKVSYLIGGESLTQEERAAGKQQQVIEVTNADHVKKPFTTKTRPRPFAYILEARSVDAIDMLKRHNIKIEVLQKDIEVEVQVYTMDSIRFASEYDHPAAASVFVGEVLTENRTFPKGSFIVKTGQVMGRIVTHMLEPETNDNVVKWNTMDFALPSRISIENLRRNRERSARAGRGGQPQNARQRPAGRGGTRAQRKPEVPIFKIMTPMPLPTKILDYK